MKFPRNNHSLRNPFEIASFAAVFFLLVIFLLLAALLPTPGLRLPLADGLPGTDQPTVALAVDAGGRLFLANQLVSEAQLSGALRAAASHAPAPLTLVINADQTVTYEQLIHLTTLARNAGIQDALLATLPRALTTPANP